MKPSAEPVPREIPREEPCPRCGCTEPVHNGAYYRKRRLDAKLTLVDMAKICGLKKSYLGRMELGQSPFTRPTADSYERLFERRRRSGDD